VSYQVFARKYRPKTFEDVLGQDHVVRTLKNAIQQNRLAHAYLFVGPRGTGKTSTARIFAKALNCPDGPKVDFDPEDELCQEIARGESLDVLEIDGASNNGVDQVRDLRETVKYAPARGKFKIYYIDEVHMLSSAAFNALLKTLEEPPAHVKFIFATTEANKILPTIISRCQRFDLRRIPASIIADHVLHIASEECVKLSEKAAYAIAKGAEGGMRDAQSMLDQLVAFCGETIEEKDVLEIFGFTAGESVSQLAGSMLAEDTVGALRVVHEQSESGKDLGRLLSDLIQYLRTLLVQQVDPEAAAEDLSPEVAKAVIEQAAMATSEQFLRMVDGLAEVDARMRWASNKRLHLELAVIQAVQALQEVSISEVIEAIDAGTGGGLAERARPQPVRRAAAPAVERPAKAVPEPKAEPKPEVAPSKAEPATRAEPDPEPKPEPAPPPAAQADDTPASPTDFQKVLGEQVRKKRGLISAWLDVATVLSIDKGVVTLGFPVSEKPAMVSLMRDNQRTFLEELSSAILGDSTRIEMTLDASLKAPEVEELDFGVAAEPEPAKTTPTPKPEEKPVSSSGASASPPDPESAEEEAASDPEFYKDPLIQKAMVKFRARLVDEKEGSK
jgi:DNA polymerase-3 subunit gamma/tau